MDKAVGAVSAAANFVNLLPQDPESRRDGDGAGVLEQGIDRE